MDLKRYIKQLVDLNFGLDKKEVINHINSNNVIAGPETWLLICSIMIASLGLDLNSPAVIIGAMLISPLMLPILGTGLAAGINDWESLSKSSINFGIAVAISILTSFIYFVLTPFGNPTDEILARTHPTFLDILIAFFGGIAGIVAATRKDLSNSIPGVAIATAIMPPLCVVGFGIANGHWMMALNAFYLFFLNSFFVALATYLIIRFLRFPYKSYINPKERVKAKYWVFSFMIILIIPSFFILNKVLTEVKTHDTVVSFISNEISLEQRKYIDSWQIYSLDTNKQLLIKLYGKQWDSITLNYFQMILSDKYDLDNMRIEIIPTSELNLSHFNKLELMITEVEGKYTNQIEQFQSQNINKEDQINKLNTKLDSIYSLKNKCNSMKSEISLLFPYVTNWKLVNEVLFNSDSSTIKSPLFSITTKKKITKIEKEKIKNFIKMRCELPEARFDIIYVKK